MALHGSYWRMLSDVWIRFRCIYSVEQHRTLVGQISILTDHDHHSQCAFFPPLSGFELFRVSPERCERSPSLECDDEGITYSFNLDRHEPSKSRAFLAELRSQYNCWCHIYMILEDMPGKDNISVGYSHTCCTKRPAVRHEWVTNAWQKMIII